MTPQERAKQLLEEWNLCVKAKPKHNAVDIQLDKDVIAPWANLLIRQMAWGKEPELIETCNQFESRLRTLKEKIIIEVLQNGSV